MTTIRAEDLTRAYGVLGLAPSAAADDVTSAYRRLVRDAHPDTRATPAPSAATRIRDVIEAYRTIQTARQREPRPETDAPLHEATTDTPRTDHHTRPAYLAASPPRSGTVTRPPDIHAQPPRIAAPTP